METMSRRPIGRPKTRWEDEVFGRYKEHEHNIFGRKLHRIEIVGRKWLSKPEPYIGCSAL
jgi:hypothetical protein